MHHQEVLPTPVCNIKSFSSDVQCLNYAEIQKSQLQIICCVRHQGKQIKHAFCAGAKQTEQGIFLQGSRLSQANVGDPRDWCSCHDPHFLAIAAVWSKENCHQHIL